MSTTQRPTPETDYHAKLYGSGDAVMAGFARQLERERDEAREWQNVKVTKNGETHCLGTLLGLLERERDEAREELAAMRHRLDAVSLRAERIRCELVEKTKENVNPPAIIVPAPSEEIQAMREAIKGAHGALKAIDDLHNYDFPDVGDFSDTAIEAFNSGNATLAKLQPFITP